MSDRIAVMNGGVVEQVATPQELYERPATAFVAGFIGVSNLIHLRVDEQDNGVAVMHLGEGERLIAHVRTAGDTGDAARHGPTGEDQVRARARRAGSNVAATVVDVVYLGSMTQIIVELPTGEQLTVHRLNDEVDARPVAVGRRVALHWAAEHSFVIGEAGRRQHFAVTRGRAGARRQRRTGGSGMDLELSDDGFVTLDGRGSRRAARSVRRSSLTAFARRLRRRRSRQPRGSASTTPPRRVRPSHRAGRADRDLRVGRLRGRHGDVGRATSSGPYGEGVTAQVHVPRERPAGAREGGLRLQPGRHPPLHRLHDRTGRLPA